MMRCTSWKLDVQFTADVQRQLYLPASRGGLGLRELARCAPAAALASWTVTFSMLPMGAMDVGGMVARTEAWVPLP